MKVQGSRFRVQGSGLPWRDSFEHAWVTSNRFDRWIKNIRIWSRSGSGVQGSRSRSRFKAYSSAPPPAKQTTGQIEKETNEHRILLRQIEHRI